MVFQSSLLVSSSARRSFFHPQRPSRQAVVTGLPFCGGEAYTYQRLRSIASEKGRVFAGDFKCNYTIRKDNT